MIPEKAIREAIEETEALPDSYDKAKKLATFYIMLDHLYPEEIIHEGYSGNTIPESGSEFMTEVKRHNETAVWAVMDELMGTLSVMNPRLYNGVMRRLREA